MNRRILSRFLLAFGLLAAFRASALPPADLQARLKAGDAITVIDVRPTVLFQQGHIPGAINIPASIVAQKQLPRLGQVVVCDAGLGEDLATAAVAALNTKPGIKAQSLDGGFAGWEDAKGETTAPSGIVGTGAFPQISYDKLKAAPADDLVLVDLRQPASTGAGKLAVKADGTPLTDLSVEFPNARIAHSPFEASPAKKSQSGTAKPPLLVLIDNGDGSAQKVARLLKANGTKRFVILAGGEETLARKGQSGLERAGSTVTVPMSVLPVNSNTNR